MRHVNHDMRVDCLLFFACILEVSSSELLARGGGGDCLKSGVFEGIMKGETLANFLRCISAKMRRSAPFLAKQRRRNRSPEKGRQNACF